MDDYAEQQAMEIEALESILMDDLKGKSVVGVVCEVHTHAHMRASSLTRPQLPIAEVTDGIPSGWNPTGKVYRVEIKPQLDDDLETEQPGALTSPAGHSTHAATCAVRPISHLSLPPFSLFSPTVIAEVVFSHTATSPDEPPLLRARAVRGLSDGDVASLQATLDSQVEENMGMPMVYQLITAAQEWITELGSSLAAPSMDPEAEERRRREEEEARLAELRRHGTPVTPESFAEWKAKFDAEMALAKAAVTDAAAASAAKGRLTGRGWFLQQEAQHIEIEEPILADDEEDGEGSRSDWSGEDPSDYFGKQLLEGDSEEEEMPSDDEDDEDDDLLDEMLNAAGGGA